MRNVAEGLMIIWVFCTANLSYGIKVWRLHRLEDIQRKKQREVIVYLSSS